LFIDNRCVGEDSFLSKDKYIVMSDIQNNQFNEPSEADESRNDENEPLPKSIKFKN
jgi:hypothetical protein